MKNLTPKQAKGILWSRGDLSWKLHSGQKVIDKAFREVSKKLFVANCSRRYGKTYWAVIVAIETAIKSKSKSIVATAFNTDLQEFILPAFDEVFKDCPKHLLPIYNKSSHKYTFKNGSTIKLVGLDKKPNGLRGNKLDGVIVIDEAGFVSNLAKLYSSVVVPATMYTNAKVILISTPPTSPDSDFKTMCDKAVQEESYVKLTIHQNPMVTPEMIQQYRNECLAESDFRREYECDFVIDENSSIIPEFDVAKHTFTGTSLRDDFYKYYRKYICFDIGVVDETAFIYAYYDYNQQKLIIECESVLQGKDVTTDNINTKLDEYPEYIKPYRTIADNNNLVLVQDLNVRFSKTVIPVKKDSLIAMVSELRWSFKQGKIQISDSCKSLIKQLASGVWNKDKSAFARQNGHHNDFIAALVYLVRSLQEYENPVPVTHGLATSNDIWVQDQYEHSSSVNQLKKLFIK